MPKKPLTLADLEVVPNKGRGVVACDVKSQQCKGACTDGPLPHEAVIAPEFYARLGGKAVCLACLFEALPEGRMAATPLREFLAALMKIRRFQNGGAHYQEQLAAEAAAKQSEREAAERSLAEKQARADEIERKRLLRLLRRTDAPAAGAEG
jgi:hypothetical protein